MFDYPNNGCFLDYFSMQFRIIYARPLYELSVSRIARDYEIICRKERKRYFVISILIFHVVIYYHAKYFIRLLLRSAILFILLEINNQTILFIVIFVFFFFFLLPLRVFVFIHFLFDANFSSWDFISKERAVLSVYCLSLEYRLLVLSSPPASLFLYSIFFFHLTRFAEIFLANRW